MIFRRCLLIACSSLLLVPLAGAEPLRVGVSVLPLKPIVSEIGGESVEVQSLQQAGDSCSVFEPRPSSIRFLGTADLFFRTGVGYETVIMNKVKNQFQNLRVVDLREAVEVHVHDHHCEHGHEAEHGLDPHIWLDPEQLKDIAAFVTAELSKALPDQAAVYTSRLSVFQSRADALNERLRVLLAPYAGRAFYIYHPALSAFAERYHLEQISIGGGGQAPTAKELHQRIREARESNVKVIFVQPQESRRHAEIIASAIGAELVEIDPLAMDWEANLLKIGEALVNSFKEID